MSNELATRGSTEIRPRYAPERQARRETVTLRDTQIIYRNFAGRPGPYNAEGERSFSVLLDEDTANVLLAQGLNVKPINRRDPDEEQMYQLPVAVSYAKRPPRVYMVTGDGEIMPLRKTMLPQDMVGMMDDLELSAAHMVLSIYNYEVRGTKGKKCYLQSFFGHVMLDELEQEYATVEDMVIADTEEHAEADNVIDGEWSEA